MILLLVLFGGTTRTRARRSRQAARRFPSPPERVIASDMISDSAVVRELKAGDPLRYLAVLEWRSKVIVFGKRGEWPDADKNERTVAFGSDLSLRLSGGVEVNNRSNLAHNLGLAVVGDRLVGIGGRYAPRKHAWQDGAGRVVASDPGMIKEQWATSFRGSVLEGGHQGCVERRVDFKKCEFDGRFSVVPFAGSILVYARANLNPEGGGRFVQVTRANRDLSRFEEPFRPIRFASSTGIIEGLPRVAANYSVDVATRYGNIYYAAVNANPADPSTLLGIFPLRVEDAPDETRVPPFSARQRKVPGVVWSEAYFGPGGWVRHHPTPNSSAIVMALSCDGVHFSAPKPIIRALPASLGRTNDHPVDGLLRRGHHVFLYVHVGVPGTFGKKPPAFRMGPPSSIHRYRLRLSALERYSRAAKIGLAGCS